MERTVIEKAFKEILLESEQVQELRPGMENTPKRYAKFLDEFITQEKDFEMTTFAAEDYTGAIVVTDIPFYSMCEHHTLPFFGIAHVSYIPNSQIIGLSKIPRVVDFFARNFQNQERLTQQIGHFLQDKLDCKGVGVILKARHMCMEMRGIKKPGCQTTTSYLTGVFLDDDRCRNEFLLFMNK